METLGSSYGACTCGAEFDARLVEVRLSGTDGAEVLRDVPLAACPNCGVRVYKAAVLERIEAAYGASRA